MDFQYMADSNNVTVPAHRIPVPDLAWPKDELPPEVLAYTDGIIREIDDTSYNREIHIYIERTSREALIAYGERHILSGWEKSRLSGSLLDGTGTSASLVNDGLNLILYLRRDDYVEIVFWYGLQVQKYW